MLPARVKEQLEKQAKDKEKAAAEKESGDFQTLGQCKEVLLYAMFHVSGIFCLVIF